MLTRRTQRIDQYLLKISILAHNGRIRELVEEIRDELIILDAEVSNTNQRRNSKSHRKIPILIYY